MRFFLLANHFFIRITNLRIGNFTERYFRIESDKIIKRSRRLKLKTSTSVNIICFAQLSAEVVQPQAQKA